MHIEYACIPKPPDRTTSDSPCPALPFQHSTAQHAHPSRKRRPALHTGPSRLALPLFFCPAGTGSCLQCSSATALPCPNKQGQAGPACTPCSCHSPLYGAWGGDPPIRLLHSHPPASTVHHSAAALRHRTPPRAADAQAQAAAGCSAHGTTTSCLDSRRITATLVGGMSPASVTTTLTKSAGMASYLRFRRPRRSVPRQPDSGLGPTHSGSCSRRGGVG